VFLAVAPPVLAADEPPPGWDDAKFLAVEDVTPGMRGIGLSVFRGTAIEEFGVEILGVMPTAFPGGDMILARLEGQDLETSGVIAGMSGSPVYIEGKLIGAVAFGWGFSKRPIAGITPIAEMLDMERREGGSSRPIGVFDTSQPRSQGGMAHGDWNRLWSAGGEDVLAILAGEVTEPGDEWTQLRTPVAMGGFGAGSRTAAAAWLRSYGLMPVQGGAGQKRAAQDASGGSGRQDGAPGTGDKSLAPGSAVMVSLVRGDAHMGALGTVTWVEEDRVYGFGHPFLALGGVNFPMTQAEVITVLPSTLSSFKMGVAGSPVGAIIRDYRPGVVGRLGPDVPMLPVSLAIDWGDRTENLSYEVLEHRTLTPVLVGIVAVNSMDALDKRGGDVTLRVTTRLELSDGRTLERENLVAGFSPPSALAGEVARLVGIVYGNPVEEVSMKRVTVNVTVESAIRASFLERVELSPGPYRPGDSVRIRIGLNDYRGDPWHHDLTLDLPSSLAPGPYTLQICDGGAARRMEQERAPGRFNPRDLDLLLDLLAREPARDAIVIQLEDAKPNPVVAGRELPGLPASWRTVIGSPLTAGRATVASRTVHQVVEERLGKVLIGCRSVAITVAARP